MGDTKTKPPTPFAVYFIKVFIEIREVYMPNFFKFYSLVYGLNELFLNDYHLKKYALRLRKKLKTLL